MDISNDPTACMEIVSRINLMRNDSEGVIVCIPNDNPDFGGPNTAVEVTTGFDDLLPLRGTGDNLLEALRDVHNQFMARKGGGRGKQPKQNSVGN